MPSRELKESCYLEMLEDSLTNVQMIRNRLSQLDKQEQIIPAHILRRDRIKTILRLELALATYCVLLRKMHENNLIDYDEELHHDINSIIHSNRFEYFEQHIVVYSARGKENVNLRKLLDFGTAILDENAQEEAVYQGKRFKKQRKGK
ncbi:MAG: hypothetical protein PUF83_00715 [Intestinibaculum porci]|jgi:hypothetical protein|uniref:Uncharacterized protein n=1 Tax=Intestinibaculum porci TaxID=2487118 RepID=A0A3G9JKU2_9FIRM|nr:hypothetical protein [Intestinibaculum porci]MDD6421579.1 hypothetical protein [Intestinibaculum porci]BBH25613.1 hypothetical protein SG0102_05470 [Intestinibaculum porci]